MFFLTPYVRYIYILVSLIKYHACLNALRVKQIHISVNLAPYCWIAVRAPMVKWFVFTDQRR